MQGEPIKEDYLSDVEAVQSGFISLSFLDYNLTTDNQDDPLINILCKGVILVLPLEEFGRK